MSHPTESADEPCPTCGSIIPSGSPGDLCPRCSLLGALEDPGEGTDLHPDPLVSHPRSVGPYQVISELGEGGFGIVYRARQERPIQRDVAVKILKTGMDTRQVIRRFEAERQTLALLDHPNIARFYDAGQTGDGRPFFAMELVEGPTISAFCGARKLDLQGRIALFLQVCDGVGHAHRKGIIHRDLKPSNILVAPSPDASHGGRPVVIDFGISRAAHTNSDGGFTVFTRAMQFLGTAEYVSPEQTSGSGVDIDTRSDVYSLGAVLYELLTGSTPVTDRHLEGATLESVGKIIRETETERPSSRITTVPREPGNTIDPTSLSSEVDWIVLRALEKDRSRRYGSVDEFAADLQRYLSGENVEARPPSRVYKYRKAFQRHWFGITAIAITSIALATSAIVGTVMAWRAEQARDHAVEVLVNSDFEAVRSLVPQSKTNEAVAHLVRILRAQPDNRSAHSALLHLLAFDPFAQQVAAPIPFDTLIDRLETDGSGRVGVSVTRADDAALWEAPTGRVLGRWTRPKGSRYTACAISPDGSLAAFGALDGSVRLVETQNPAKNVVTIGTPSRSSVRFLGFSPGGKTFYVVAGKSLSCWNSSGEELWKLPLEPDSYPASFATSPDGRKLAIGDYEGKIAIVRAADGIAQNTEQRHSRRVTSLEFSPDGKKLGSASDDGTTTVVDLTDPQIKSLRWQDTHRVNHICFSPDGTRLVASSAGGHATIWSLATGERLGVPLTHRDEVYRAQFSPDGTTVVTTSRDLTARLWSAETGCPLTAPLPHNRTPSHPAFSDGGLGLTTGSRDGKIRFWQVPDERNHRSLALPVPLKFLDFSRPVAGGAPYHLGAVGADGRVLAWETDRFDPLEVGLTISREKRPLAYTLDQRLGALHSKADNRVEVWDNQSRVPIFTSPTIPNQVTRAAFYPDNSAILVGDHSGAVHLFSLHKDPKSVAKPASAQIFDSGTRRVYVSSGARFAVVTSDGGSGQILSLPGLEEIGEPIAHDGAILSVRFSSDDSVLATGSEDNTARAWSTATGKPLTPPLAHSDIAWEDTGIMPRFADGDSAIVTAGSHDLTVRIWDLASGRQRIAPIYLNAHVMVLRTSPDGTRIAAGDDERRLHLWDAATGVPLCPPRRFASTLQEISFSPDSRFLAATDTSGTLRIYPLPETPDNDPGRDFLDRAERLAGKRFTREGYLELMPFDEMADGASPVP